MVARCAWLGLMLGVSSAGSLPRRSATVVNCDVVVVGGSVAGLAAAVTSAKEGVTTCLLAPTDMVGGQMTANGIPALDFSTEDGRKPFNESGAGLDTMAANQATDLQNLLRSLPGPNYRNTCWVSAYCFLPTQLESNGIAALLRGVGPNLRVYRETVLLDATTAPQPGNGSQRRRIESVRTVQRTPTEGTPCGGYGTRLSESLPDWYSPEPSPAFHKAVLEFRSPVWIDTSYNGELLALAAAPYLQGIDEAFDGDVSGTSGNDTIGQCFTMTYHSHLHGVPVPQPDHLPGMNPSWVPPNPFRASPAIHTPTNRLDWASLWTRRRSYHSFAPPHSAKMSPRPVADNGGLGMDPPPVNNVSAGDVHLAAWPDFYYGYVFTSKATTQHSVGTPSWVGGYNVANIEAAERYSYGAYRTYARAAPPQWLNHTDLNSSYLGTCTGLSKMPYIRDGRRSVGVGGFVIDINFTARYHTPSLPPDCVALMGHGFDIWGHRMMDKPMDNTGSGIATCAPNDTTCEAYPQYMRGSGGTGYTCAPLRAFTNAAVANLVVGGYTMAQSFMVNSGLRMHPEEFQGGVAAGAAAAHLSAAKVASTEAALSPSIVAAIQARIKRHAPLEYSGAPPPFPGPIGFICAAALGRCVQVPGGGAFNKNNTRADCGSCRPLAANEWVAIHGSFDFDSTTMKATFRTATRIKKSFVNSGMIPSNQSLPVAPDQQLKLTRDPSAPIAIDKYTYVLVTCAEPRCGL